MKFKEQYNLVVKDIEKLLNLDFYDMLDLAKNDTQYIGKDNGKVLGAIINKFARGEGETVCYSINTYWGKFTIKYYKKSNILFSLPKELQKQVKEYGIKLWEIYAKN